VVRWEGTFRRWTDKVFGENIRALGRYHLEMAQYRHKLRVYKDKKSEKKKLKKEEEFQKAVDEAKAAQNAQRIKNSHKKNKAKNSGHAKKAEKPRQNSPQFNWKENVKSKEYQEALKKVVMANFSKQIGKSKKTPQNKK
jgi:murein L,D-transpeptidase YcbB/YkuD